MNPDLQRLSTARSCCNAVAEWLACTAFLQLHMSLQMCRGKVPAFSVVLSGGYEDKDEGDYVSVSADCLCACALLHPYSKPCPTDFIASSHCQMTSKMLFHSDPMLPELQYMRYENVACRPW